MAAPHQEAEEEERILGVTVAAPRVLKAIQVMLVSVAVGDLLLLSELIEVAETRGLKGTSHFERTLWVMDVLRALAMTVSSYLGVRKDSARLLGLACALSMASAFTTVCVFCTGVFFSSGVVVSYIVPMQLTAAVLFAVGAHQSWVLRNKAMVCSLFSAQPGGVSRDGYVMLGMPMIDLKVLRWTQMLFTAQAIASVTAVCSGISLELTMCRALQRDLPGVAALKRGVLPLAGGHFSLMLLGMGLIGSPAVMACQSYYGIKRSHEKILREFSLECFLVACALIVTSVWQIPEYGFKGTSLVFLGNAAATVVAGFNGVRLASAVRAGKALTAQEVREGAEMIRAFSPAQLGAPGGAA